MQLISYLNFAGQCETAFNFYEHCLGGKIEAMITHAGTPAEEHTPPAWRDKIMHARLSVQSAVLMGSDVPPEHYKKPEGYAVSIVTKDPVEADRVFGALSENATVTMPIQKTFWAQRFGMLTDQFGIAWMVNCE